MPPIKLSSFRVPSPAKYYVALVTAPSLAVARKLARAALKERLAACANLVPGLESHYWWQGKLEKSREVLVVFKTAGALLKKLEESVLQNHPYDTPEFVAIPLAAGNQRYLDWIGESVAPTLKSPPRG